MSDKEFKVILPGFNARSSLNIQVSQYRVHSRFNGGFGHISPAVPTCGQCPYVCRACASYGIGCGYARYCNSIGCC